ncbi:MAG TPA: LPS export ABC transporter periplasmic protein LptC [Rhodocyclaceae bacterium]|nr:LPS export ABC transporter periplasmic protein LptC [Rhodocyclaceae bacterium]HMV53314.1 LPS export ABC transporter periplasmic protein LptC [Rhodocyclaceae bacterium]HMZ82989.1 LPS export ABC transporter periplasmic protein LptC [Rhodocyclaceae bacterium]HNA04986.1 LPS export ABC transporter periplasmic protein LptC [Rhodocyclaceae bacterium]HNB78469.1 LPS export ABC transporter periplasmic protein LptC [Rhodocyclaceae bacterium]
MRSTGRWHSIYPIVMIGLLAALTLWLNRAIQFEPVRSDGKLRHDPDYIVDKLNGKRFDEKGKLQYSLIADRMIHYPDDDTTELMNPRMVHTGRKEPLRASATRANLSKDGKVVTLIDNVKLIREATAGRPEMTLTTSTLTLRPDDETATTDAPVTITHGKSVIRGTGFDYNNITAVAILRASVRGTLARGG